MKYRRLIKFYFSADGIDRALNNLILNEALKSADSERKAEYFAERISALIEAKSGLSSLWVYLDGVMRSFTDAEIEILKRYGEYGKRSADCRQVREIRRVTVKFARRARMLGSFAGEIGLLAKYYCFCGCSRS